MVGENRKNYNCNQVVLVGHSLTKYKHNRIARDLNLDSNNADFSTCAYGCFVDA